MLKPPAYTGGVLGVVTVKVRLAVAPAVSVAVSVIDQLPTTPGMPLNVRVLALKKAEEGDDVVITVFDDVLVIENMTMAELDADDFVIR